MGVGVDGEGHGLGLLAGGSPRLSRFVCRPALLRLAARREADRLGLEIRAQAFGAELAAELEDGAQIELPEEYAERAAYVVEGEVEAAGERHAAGRMVVFAAGEGASVGALTAARVMLLGGAALEGPREIWWNFVSSSADRIERAKIDWHEDRFAAVPGDDERIPLPER